MALARKAPESAKKGRKKGGVVVYLPRAVKRNADAHAKRMGFATVGAWIAHRVAEIVGAK